MLACTIAICLPLIHVHALIQMNCDVRHCRKGEYVEWFHERTGVFIDSFLSSPLL